MTRAGSGSLPRYILQRAALVIPMIWVILTLVFIVLRVAPGDPVSAALGGKLNEQALEQRLQALGRMGEVGVELDEGLSKIEGDGGGGEGHRPPRSMIGGTFQASLAPSYIRSMSFA